MRDTATGRNGRAAGGIKFEEDNAKDLFDAKLVSQCKDEDEGGEEASPRRRRKKQSEPDNYKDNMDRKEIMKHLYAMRKWAQEVPQEFREGGMNMLQANTAACETPATITPKRKRKEVANDAMDGEDDQEDLETVGSESEPERDDTA